MSFGRQIIVLFGSFFVSFPYIRCFFYGLIRYQLNNSAYKKRKKRQSFKEWLFYDRFKEEIPKILRVIYYSILIIHLFCLISCIFIYITGLPSDIGRIFAVFLFNFDGVWMSVIGILFWTPRRPDWAFERWIKIKRGQKKHNNWDDKKTKKSRINSIIMLVVVYLFIFTIPIFKVIINSRG